MRRRAPLRAAYVAALLAAMSETANALPPAILAPPPASSPTLAPWMRAPLPLLFRAGDSRNSISVVYQTVPGGAYPNPVLTEQPSSVVAWAHRILGARFAAPLNLGYQGINAVPIKVVITSGGSQYSTNSVCTYQTGNGTLGAPTVDQNGSILTIPQLSSGTAALTTAPIVACTGGTGLNAVGVLGGTGTFANAGETSAQFYSRIPDIEAQVPQGAIIYLRIGTNDETAGISLAQSVANMKAIFDRLLGDGYYVIYQLDGPRSVWGSFTDANSSATQYRKQMYARRSWVRQYKYDLIKNSNAYPHFYIFDTFAEQVDTTNAYGDPKTNYTADGLHDSQLSAYIAGWKLAQVLDRLLPGTSDVVGNLSQAGVYDATYNPYGAINSNPSLTGTGGAMPAGTGSTSVSGTAPTGYSLSLSGTSGTQSIAGGIEGARTDGYNGSRPQFIISCGGAGSASQTYTLTPGYTALSSLGWTSATNGTASAPVVALDVDVEFSSETNLRSMQAFLSINDISTIVYSSADGSSSNTTSTPMGNTGTSDGPVPALGSGVTLHFQTQPIVLNNIGTIAGTQVQMKPSFTWGLDCSGTSTGSAGVTVKFTRFNLHEIP